MRSELLRQLTDIAGAIPEGKGQLARAYFKLSVLCTERERIEDSRRYKALAEQVRRDVRPDLADHPCTEDEFMKLCLWMLW